MQVIPNRVLIIFAQTTGLVNVKWLLAYKFVASGADASAGSVGTGTFNAASGVGSAVDSESGSGSSGAAGA